MLHGLSESLSLSLNPHLALNSVVKMWEADALPHVNHGICPPSRVPLSALVQAWQELALCFGRAFQEASTSLARPAVPPLMVLSLRSWTVFSARWFRAARRGMMLLDGVQTRTEAARRAAEQLFGQMKGKCEEGLPVEAENASLALAGLCQVGSVVEGL